MGTVGIFFPFLVFIAFKLGYAFSDKGDRTETATKETISWLLMYITIWLSGLIFFLVEEGDFPKVVFFGIHACGLWFASSAGKHFKLGRRSRFIFAFVVTLIYTLFAVIWGINTFLCRWFLHNSIF